MTVRFFAEIMGLLGKTERYLKKNKTILLVLVLLNIFTVLAINHRILCRDLENFR